MIRAYHVILSAYGFWLPNDPRGSWSDFVAAWDLYYFGGKATRVTTRASVAHEPHDRQRRLAAKEMLKYHPVRFDQGQIDSIARGFACASEEGSYVVRACAILPDHAHLVIARHSRNITQSVAHLKARASQSLCAEGLHPFADQRRTDGSLPSVWAASSWRVFIDNDEHLLAAVAYVENNPVKGGLPRQQWEFVRASRLVARSNASGKPGG